MMRVVEHLEDPVMLHHPCHVPAHEGAEDFRRHPVMVLRRQPVADVVQQGRHDPVDIRAVPFRPRGRLQPVFRPRDPVAFQRHKLLPPKLLQHAIGGQSKERLLQLMEQLVLLLSAVLSSG